MQSIRLAVIERAAPRASSALPEGRQRSLVAVVGRAALHHCTSLAKIRPICTNISRCSPSARCSFFLLRFPVRRVFVFVFVGASSPLFRLDESLNRQVVESEDCKSFPVSTASGSPPPTHILSYREKSSKDSPFSVVNSTGKSDTPFDSRAHSLSPAPALGAFAASVSVHASGMVQECDGTNCYECPRGGDDTREKPYTLIDGVCTCSDGSACKTTSATNPASSAAVSYSTGASAVFGAALVLMA
jgi:hypothetical protein